MILFQSFLREGNSGFCWNLPIRLCCDIAPRGVNDRIKVPELVSAVTFYKSHHRIYQLIQIFRMHRPSGAFLSQSLNYWSLENKQILFVVIRLQTKRGFWDPGLFGFHVLRKVDVYMQGWLTKRVTVSTPIYVNFLQSSVNLTKSDWQTHFFCGSVTWCLGTSLTCICVKLKLKLGMT